jgi:Uncharacterised protein family (UPF0149)
MTLDPDHGFELLSSEDQERLERIIEERSAAACDVPALHGMLTACVVGPKPVPLDWVVKTVLSDPCLEASEFDHFPEFSWASEKIEELFLRISRVFQQDHQMFRPLFSQPELEEGDTTPDPRTWCLGFVQSRDVSTGGMGAASFDEIGYSHGSANLHDSGSGRMGKQTMI